MIREITKAVIDIVLAGDEHPAGELRDVAIKERLKTLHLQYLQQ